MITLVPVHPGATVIFLALLAATWALVHWNIATTMHERHVHARHHAARRARKVAARADMNRVHVLTRTPSGEPSLVLLSTIISR